MRKQRRTAETSKATHIAVTDIRTGVSRDLIGYKVEATDGSIGKVDKHSDDVTSSYLVVDTGVWIFGKHVLLPAGTVSRVDNDEKKVFVGARHIACRAPPPRHGP
ncbi:PRC-barrel domain-containing protein [Streptomyces sp. NRRL F-3218]|uniref:PRC-barrel domain-containing protein n=1 Tax=Streptomyces sp. NRRL F-3218 TaxID=1463847 RepID=UPI000A52E6F5|nr:PRC-barrel domain-containing protein [Streptomyces sp. NRRL F-3218]